MLSADNVANATYVNSTNVTAGNNTSPHHFIHPEDVEVGSVVLGMILSIILIFLVPVQACLQMKLPQVRARHPSATDLAKEAEQAAIEQEKEETLAAIEKMSNDPQNQKQTALFMCFVCLVSQTAFVSTIVWLVNDCMHAMTTEECMKVGEFALGTQVTLLGLVCLGATAKIISSRKHSRTETETMNISPPKLFQEPDARDEV
jgi:hypothetical protein